MIIVGGFLVALGSFIIGLVVGEGDVKSNLAKKAIADGLCYLRFKKGFETYHLKIEKRSHLSEHIADDEIIDWGKL